MDRARVRALMPPPRTRDAARLSNLHGTSHTQQQAGRVFLNGRFLVRAPTGVDRFATELLRAWMPRYGASRGARIVAPPQPLWSGALPPCEVSHRGRVRGHLWEQMELLRLFPDEILLSLCNTAPILRSRQLVVLHDAAALRNPQDYSRAFRTWYRMLFRGLMSHSRVVASVSRFAADELTRQFSARANQVELISEGGEHILATASETQVLDRLNLRNTRYVLAVGSRNRNKNLRGVALAAAQLTDIDVKFVAAGGGNSRVFGDFELPARNCIATGYVSDGELRALYEHAECFVFPSFYEGFGLPPLEAMHCGCPVIASNRASLPEVCGEAVLYCDPDSPADIASCIRRVLNSPALRDDLRQAGFERARLFSWAAAANQLEEIIARNFT